MITLQRKLLIKIRDKVINEGKAPKAMKANHFYPVVGYSVQIIKRENRENEELTGFYFINQKDEVAFVYSSYCEVSLDPCQEEIANMQQFKQEGSDQNGKEDTSGSPKE